MDETNNGRSFFNTTTKVMIGVSILMFLLFCAQIFENNMSGYIQVQQGAASGKITVKTSPGVYLQLFDTITSYKMSDVYDFKTEKIAVKFNDGSTAMVGGQAQFKLPLSESEIKKLHIDFRSYDNVMNNLIKRVVSASLIQSANSFRAEEVYSTRRSEFIDLVTDQIREGIYATSWREEWVKDPETLKQTLIKRVEVKRNANGSPVVNDPSAFRIYNIELVSQVLIDNIDFDDLTDGLIAKRKEAEQQQVVARANAERAKQDAITAVEEGKRDIARAEAEALVVQKKAVVEAEKETKIAQQKALQAEEEKKAIVAKGEADSLATKLKVAAGLSPLEKANIDKETAIGVAQALAGIKFPHIMVIGGESKDGAKVSPFDAVGIQALMQINKDFVKGNQ